MFPPPSFITDLSLLPSFSVVVVEKLRVAGLANASAMAFACLLFSRVTKEAASLTIFFYLLRFLGQGGMQLIGTNLISNWWIRRRGLMQGISGVGLAISMTGLFPIVARMGCESIGWRGTFTVIGVVLLVVFVPLCAIFFCETPEVSAAQFTFGPLDGLTD